MPRTVIILRHAEPDIQPDQSPAEWRLSPTGRAAAAAVGQQRLCAALLASSGEPKAVETIRLAAGVQPASIHIDDRFGEVRRPGEPFDDNHGVRRRAWVEGRSDTRHETWETPVQAAHRFQRGLDGIDADRVAVATHGMVLTAWLVSIGHVEAGSAAGEFWAGLRFPDVLTVTI
jgi:broad specificity phosphatase PhoE